MPDPKYHPSSFAYATTAVAEDLDRIAETIQTGITATELFRCQQRLVYQATVLREIAEKYRWSAPDSPSSPE